MKSNDVYNYIVLLGDLKFFLLIDTIKFLLRLYSVFRN